MSLRKEDLRVLRARADRLYGGNLSAVLGDYAKLARYEEGADKLLEWLTEDYQPTPQALAAVEAEWNAPVARPTPKAPRKRRRAA